MFYVNRLIISSVILLFIAKTSECSDEPNCSTITLGACNGYSTHYFHFEENSGKWKNLKFYAKSGSSGFHVYLSETPDNATRDKYIITLSTFTTLRVGSAFKRNFTPAILSSIEIRPFWINVSRGGEVDVGTDKTILLSHMNDNPFHVKYYGFCTELPRRFAKVYFNCAEGGSEETKFPLSTEEKLRRDVTDTLDSVLEPAINDWEHFLPITITPNIWRISLDEQISKFSMYGIATLEWFDGRLIWEAEQYNSTYEIFIEHYRSWKPQIVLFNSFQSKNSKPFTTGPMKITSEGYVTWFTRLEIHSACAVEFQNWPWDSHVCKVRLGMWSHNEILIYSQIEEIKSAKSEWIIYDYKSSSDVSVMDNIPENLNRTIVEIQLTLKRKISFYHKLFYYMFIAGSVLLLLSVCISSLGTIRIFLNGFCVLLMTIFLLIAANSLPEVAGATPATVTAYSFMLVISSIYCSVAIFLIGMTRMEHKSSPPERISLILDNPLLCTILFLPQQTAGTMNINGIENDKKKPDFSEKWIKLSIAVDRLLLISAILFTFFLIPEFSSDNEQTENYE